MSIVSNSFIIIINIVQLIPNFEEKLNKNQIDEIFQFIKLNKKAKIQI